MNPKLTISDVRKAGFCVRGLKAWYDLQGFDLPFKSFLRDGVDLAVARKLTDPHIQRAVEMADARIKAERGADK